MVARYRAGLSDYLGMQEEPPYAEYVDGEIVERAMPDWFHALIVKRLTLLFAAYEERAGGASGPEVRIELTTGDAVEYRIPDYAYWGEGRPRRRGRFGAPPTLAIEVRSPDEPLASQREKCRAYRRNGVEVAWLIDPVARTVEVFDAASDGVMHGSGAIASEALPGLRIELAGLFAVLDEA
jgi:Uma2 family endonuclease